MNIKNNVQKDNQQENIGIYHLYGGDIIYPGEKIGVGIASNEYPDPISARPSVAWSSNVYTNQYVIGEWFLEGSKCLIYIAESNISTASALTLKLGRSDLIPWGFSGGVSNDFVFIAIQKKTHQDGKILTLTPPPKSCKDSQPSKFFRWPKIIEGKTYRLIRGDRQTMFYYEAMNSVDENTKVTEGDTVKFREKDIEPPLSV